jgi:DNA-binding response OmpR family regulator
MPRHHDPYDGWDDEPTAPVTLEAPTRVLLAEDDPELRAILSARLRRDGHDVVEVGDGDHALRAMTAIAEHGAPTGDLDLAILDVRMPGISGVEVVYMLRHRRWTTPVLLITAFPEPELLEEARRLGVSILAKPFAIERLGPAAAATMRGTRVSP